MLGEERSFTGPSHIAGEKVDVSFWFWCPFSGLNCFSVDACRFGSSNVHSATRLGKWSQRIEIPTFPGFLSPQTDCSLLLPNPSVIMCIWCLVSSYVNITNIFLGASEENEPKTFGSESKSLHRPGYRPFPRLSQQRKIKGKLSYHGLPRINQLTFPYCILNTRSKHLQRSPTMKTVEHIESTCVLGI